MEFLRFGSSIPGGYWGCCACCIIQNFKVDPDAKASIQLIEGDGGTPMTHPKGGFMFAGPTYRDIFWQRLRYGTFSNRDMPNHAFFAILSRSQLTTAVGLKWLAILKEAGFEFLRTVNNSVWNVDNYIFALIRNVGNNHVGDQFTPPAVWTDLPSVVPETWERLGAVKDRVALTKEMRDAATPLFAKLPSNVFLTEKDVEDAKAPVIYAGVRSQFPPEPKAVRESKKAAATKATALKRAPISPIGAT